MGVGTIFVVIFFTTLAGQLRADFSMNYCSISCRDNQGQSASNRTEGPIKLVGPPGEQGATGSTGPPGPPGEKGLKGEAGMACSCKHVEDSINSLLSTVDNLKRECESIYHRGHF